jgi:glycosyltransferase involved in cell wall biosynthesis
VLPCFTENPNAHIVEEKYRGNASIRLCPVVESEYGSLGALRNYSVEMARGDIVVQWDDDDWYHKRRIEVQFQVICLPVFSGIFFSGEGGERGVLCAKDGSRYQKPAFIIRPLRAPPNSGNNNCYLPHLL